MKNEMHEFKMWIGFLWISTAGALTALYPGISKVGTSELFDFFMVFLCIYLVYLIFESKKLYK